MATTTTVTLRLSGGKDVAYFPGKTYVRLRDTVLGTTYAGTSTVDGDGGATILAVPFAPPVAYYVEISPTGTGSWTLMDVNTVSAYPFSASASTLTLTGPKLAPFTLVNANDEFFASNPASALAGNIFLLPAPNGTDDTATIQAALTAARIAGGGEVWGLGGALGTGFIYKASQLIIGSNTRFFLANGVSIQQLASFNGNLLQNYAVANARTVMDAVTNGTTTLTSATAAFVAGDVGKTLWVQGADVDGEILKTTIASRTNATTVVMANAAVQTQAATQASIGPRDTNIVLFGGVWDRDSANPSGSNTAQTLRFRRVDNLTISDTTIRGALPGAGRYGISLADVTDYSVDRITWDHQGSDGLHINGPARRGVIRDFRGQTGDDMVSLTSADWPGTNDVFGDILDCTIEDIRPFQTNNTAVKVLGGSNGAQILNCKHIRVKKVAGYATNLDENEGGLVWIGDDAGNAATVGGRVDDVQVEGVWGNTTMTSDAKGTQVFINGTNVGTVRIRNLHIESGASTLHGIVVAQSAVVDCLDVDGVSVVSCSATSEVVKLVDVAHVTTLMVSHVNGAISHFVVNESTANNVINYAFFNFIEFTNAAALGLMYTQPGAYLFTLTATNVHSFAGLPFIVGQLGDYIAGAGVIDVFLSNIHTPNLSNAVVYLLSATTKIRMHGSGALSLNGKQPTLNGGQFSSKDVGYPVDTTLLTPNAAGDLAFHNNAATTPYILGPAQYDGTRWRPLQGFMASGTAVLVAGAVTVADTKVTANSVIRVFMRTPGGTPGAHFIGALTAATSFQIKSTSATDTSTVYYEVEAY